jgi:antitoxin FitA
MAQLIVRNIEDSIVRKLKRRAAREGVSSEEEHRRILRDSLLGKARSHKMDFKAFLLSMPDLGDDSLFKRNREMPRRVKLG